MILSTFILQIKYTTLANFCWNCVSTVMRTRHGILPFLLAATLLLSLLPRENAPWCTLSSIICCLFTAAETAGERKRNSKHFCPVRTNERHSKCLILEALFHYFSFVFPCFCSLSIGGNLSQKYQGGHANKRSAYRPTPTNTTSSFTYSRKRKLPLAGFQAVWSS